MIRLRYFFSLLAVSVITGNLFADEPAPVKIPGIDFTKPAPQPSPSPSPKPPFGTGKRGRSSPAKAKPAFGVGAAGNNDGYTAGQGKVKIGF